MKNPLFNMKSVITGSYKAIARAGAGAETFLKSEPERKQIVLALQHCSILSDKLINFNQWIDTISAKHDR
jgi:hypothetical protein